ncbi:MAG TPA: redoxin domain-containing protein [Chthonomonadaceae bacterium]|nr:redoxin domain-containing protein [Chthonomonadaceae bacterium]
MFKTTKLIFTLCLCGATLPLWAQTTVDPGKNGLDRSLSNADPSDRSHSHISPAFDQGPRQLAHLMTGVGNVHFSVTTSSPEAQKFFDQGVNLLYSFSWYEAERSFRQVALLDPDCAMAYWGMAMADGGRAKDFLKLAQTKQDHITDRERRYIEALAIDYRDNDPNTRTADNIKALEQLTLAYPEDVEAKAMLAWALKGQQNGGITFKTAIDALLKQVIAKNPLHPGAHHFRIHMWDNQDAPQAALDSCKAFPLAAPNIGHAQHMPGHIYSRLGMWDEATYAMDAAARDERHYFYTQGQMPFDSWDYAHDQDFLISSMGYGGRIEEGAALAWELIGVPHDPNYNNGSRYTTAGDGRFGLMRVRVRGERWDEILTGPDPGWSDDADDQLWKHYTFALAWLAKGDQAKAKAEYAEMGKVKAGGSPIDAARLEISGRIALADGDTKKAIEDIKKAAELEKANFKYGDPIGYPRPLYETLAWAQMQAKQWADAEATLKEGLERSPKNGFALCLKIECSLDQGKRDEAKQMYEVLRGAWAHADGNLPALHRVQTAELDADIAAGRKPSFPTPYKAPAALTRLGPARWQPFPASDFVLTGADGKTVRLADFRGHNLVLVFTLGGACPGCNVQVKELSDARAAFDKLDTRVAIVSRDTPETNRDFLKANPTFGPQLLTDVKAAAARKYKAYDEFENLDLHCILLINKEGRVWWYRAGSEPFRDVKFLQSEIVRMDAWKQPTR